MKTISISFSLLLLLNFSLTKAQQWEFVGLDSLLVFHLYVKNDTIYAGVWDKNYNLESGLYFTVDAGNEWNRLDSILGEGAILGFEKNINNTIYIIKCPCQSGNAGTLYKTTNNGQSWEPVNNISNNKIRWIGVSAFNANEMYAIDSYSLGAGRIFNSLYKTTDLGNSWEIAGYFPSSSHGSEITFAFDKTDSMNLYISVDDRWNSLYFFKSTDEGSNWFYVSALYWFSGKWNFGLIK